MAFLHKPQARWSRPRDLYAVPREKKIDPKYTAQDEKGISTQTGEPGTVDQVSQSFTGDFSLVINPFHGCADGKAHSDNRQ